MTIEHKIFPDGTQAWYKDGKLHCDDGPAWIDADGSRGWYNDGKLHRIDGPAWIDADGRQEWRKDGEFHCEDGPAWIGADGEQEWYLDGVRYSFADWLNKVKQTINSSEKNSVKRLMCR